MMMRDGVYGSFIAGMVISSSKIQLVRLDTVLAFDPALTDIADLEMGFSAKRKSPDNPWTIERE
jgi:hypothetical protein